MPPCNDRVGTPDKPYQDVGASRHSFCCLVGELVRCYCEERRSDLHRCVRANWMGIASRIKSGTAALLIRNPHAGLAPSVIPAQAEIRTAEVPPVYGFPLARE